MWHTTENWQFKLDLNRSAENNRDNEADGPFLLDEFRSAKAAKGRRNLPLAGEQQ